MIMPAAARFAHGSELHSTKASYFIEKILTYPLVSIALAGLFLFVVLLFLQRRKARKQQQKFWPSKGRLLAVLLTSFAVAAIAFLLIAKVAPPISQGAAEVPDIDYSTIPELGLSDPANIISAAPGTVSDQYAEAVSEFCDGYYVVDGVTLPSGDPLCTHGPDIQFNPTDANRERELLKQSWWRKLIPKAEAAFCRSPGSVGGRRVQLLYVRKQSTPDRLAANRDLFEAIAESMRKRVNSAAEKFGYSGEVRYVSLSTCKPVITTVVIPDSTDLSLSGIATALAEQGHNRADRTYSMWVDEIRTFVSNGQTFQSCGFGSGASSDTPDANLNYFSRNPTYALVYKNCWAINEFGLLGAGEAHELGHALGAVQRSAPNATSDAHCTDGISTMCRGLSGSPLNGKVWRVICQDEILDCGFDDYFHPNPPAGSYLATHWNLARNPAIDVWSATISPDTTPPTASFSSPSSGTTISAGIPLVASVKATDYYDISKVELRVANTVLTDTTYPYEFSWNTSNVAPGSYSLTATAFDSSNNSASATISINVTPAVTVITPAYIDSAATTSSNDSSGINWRSDAYFSGGTTLTVTSPIDNTTKDFVYQTERYGNFNYAIPIKNGIYPVHLHFSENYHNSSGKRIFNVRSEGHDVIMGLDIFAKSGARFKAHIENFETTVRDGVLNLEFVSTVDQANVTGIEIANAVLDSVKPIVTLAANPDAAQIGDNIELTAKATDNVEVTKVEFFEAGVLLGTGQSEGDNSYTFQYTASGAPGNKTFTAKAYDAAGNVATSTAVSATVSRRIGDVNNDGVVNGADISIVLGNYGVASSDLSRGDVNSDGLVNALDLSQIISFYGM